MASLTKNQQIQLQSLVERGLNALTSMGHTKQQAIYKASKLNLDDESTVKHWEDQAESFKKAKKLLSSSAKNEKVVSLHNHLIVTKNRIQNEILPLAGFLGVPAVDPVLFRSLEDVVSNIEEYFNKL